ncbi:uncharacterized protein CTRU02_202444 [Colletotrichum truncatum]|uniref:Uncharacterized protein n=1 Tax=Colletotrichum truncatum TaxID=5467 RepID=A0ACC3ZKV1_COLTU|nr:uncharacterized protein CTRU02_01611 [Colletotrichum truncatum]KAF6799932.1 hypothetical protein CTRU02_01611 [Colletotrichum truncatum]
MQLTNIITFMAPISLASAYTFRGSVNYCNQDRGELIWYNNAKNVCRSFGGKGFASFNFVDVGPNTACFIFPAENCQGGATQYNIGSSGSTGCRDSSSGWVYSVACS